MHQADALAFSLRVVGACGISGALLFTGGGVAAADDLVGQTYGDAKDLIASRGGTVDVSTTFGDRAELDDCIVSNAHKSTNPGSQGGSATVLVDLNCNSGYDGTHPGYSLGSPQGRRLHDAREAKAAQQQAQQQAALEAQQQAEADAAQGDQ